jgi:hypothetical protein
MVRIAISQAAFDAIAATLSLGSVGYENATNERGERLIWLEDAMADHLFPTQRRCYARHGVDRPASRHAGPALPASTSSLVQHGRAAMLKPMIDNPLASLRCPPEALHGRPETADTVAAV